MVLNESPIVKLGSTSFDPAAPPLTEHAIERGRSRPKMPPIRWESVPAALKERAQWVHWEYRCYAPWRERVNGRWVVHKGRVAKVPVYFRGGDASPLRTAPASSTGPNTWTDFETARRLVNYSDWCREWGYPQYTEDSRGIGKTFDAELGVGFVFTDEAGLVGIDIDKCRDPDTGEVTPFARAIVDRLDSYTEVSPSGKGLKVFALARLPGDNAGRRECRRGVELYGQGRYFTVTGQRLDGTPAEPQERQAEVEALYRELFPDDDAGGTDATSGGDGAATAGVQAPVRRRGQGRAADPPRGYPAPAASLSDAELIGRAMGAANGDRFRRLWHGDAGDYPRPDGTPDHSSGDLALANSLAWWTGGDAGRVERLMRQSGLARAKWDRHRTYLARTIAKAIAGQHTRRADYWSGESGAPDPDSSVEITIARKRHPGACHGGCRCGGDGASTPRPARQRDYRYRPLTDDEFAAMAESAAQAAARDAEEQRQYREALAAVRAVSRQRPDGGPLHCPTPQIIGLDSRPEWLRDGEAPHALFWEKPCGSWACPACAHFLRRKWAANARLRLAVLPTVYVAEVHGGAEWEKVRKRIHLNNCEFVRITLNGGATHYVYADGPDALRGLNGVRQVSGQAAAEEFAAKLDAHKVAAERSPKRRNRPVAASKPWECLPAAFPDDPTPELCGELLAHPKLRKLYAATNRYELVAKFSRGVTLERAELITKAYGCATEYGRQDNDDGQKVRYLKAGRRGMTAAERRDMIFRAARGEMPPQDVPEVEVVIVPPRYRGPGRNTLNPRRLEWISQECRKDKTESTPGTSAAAGCVPPACGSRPGALDGASAGPPDEIHWDDTPA